VQASTPCKNLLRSHASRQLQVSDFDKNEVV